MVVACRTHIGTHVRRRRPLPRVHGTCVTSTIVLRRSNDTTRCARRGKDLACRTKSTRCHVFARGIPSASLVLVNRTQRARPIIRTGFRHTGSSRAGGGESLSRRACTRGHLNTVAVDYRLVPAGWARLAPSIVCRAAEAVGGRRRVGMILLALWAGVGGHVRTNRVVGSRLNLVLSSLTLVAGGRGTKAVSISGSATETGFVPVGIAIGREEATVHILSGVDACERVE